MPRHSSATDLSLRHRLAGRVALLILVAVCAVAAHQATYLLGFGGEGFGQALGAGGHDGHWTPLVALVLLAGTLLGMVTSHQLRRLSARAAHLDVGSHPDGELRAFVWSTAVLWLRLGLATTVAYAVQENTERVVVGLAPSGLDALAAHGLLPIIVILVTSLAIATVAALVRWRCETLLARLARRIAPRRDRSSRSARPSTSTGMLRHIAPLARGSRAPPVPGPAV